MDYFTKNFNKINYKPQEKHEDTGLRNAQLGAIHAIASHFTLHHQKPSIISLPTGTGKTGVITLAPFVLRRKRVLIITYMKLVRNQIAENFIELQDLKKLEVLPLATKPPKVKELTNILSEDKEFKELENYDVVVSLAVNILKIKNFNYLDLFDCVIFDEAHHSATSSWTDLMNYFPQAHKLLFTATPYRRDDKEIQGKIVYHYPIQKAFEDGVFGEIKYEQVHGENVKNKDFEIAKRTDEIFRRDALLKYNHVVLVRVKDKGRAKEIKKIYDKTSLKLEIINSDYSSKQIQTVLNKLTKCEIDGVITVNMLGEGFNYPRFKIAAIHDTHKSVAVALQFIGRFARTNAIERIGAATFIAFEDKEFKLEKEHLYSESAKWQEIINNVNESIIDKQIKTHRHIESYNSISGNENIEDLPLYSLRPKSHVKVYKCSQVPDLDAEIILPNEQQEFSYISPVNNVRILVTSITFSPNWIKSNVINNKEYNLYILYFNEANNYLLIHSSNVKSEFLYQTICEQVLLPDQFRKVPSYQIERVLLDVKDFDIFNLGLKNIQQKEPGMSYQTKNGRNPIRDVSDGEVNNSSPGHAFGRGKSINPDGSEGSNLTIGFSAGSKVWSSHNSRLDQFVDWCDIIIKKIVSTRDIDVNPVYNSFARASIIEKFPSNIFHLQWNVENDFNLYLAKLSYSDSNSAFAYDLVDIDLRLQRQISEQEIEFNLQLENIIIATVNYNINGKLNIVNSGFSSLFVTLEDDQFTLLEFLNLNPPQILTTDACIISNGEMIRRNSTNLLFDKSILHPFDWKAQKTNIKREFGATAAPYLSIHEVLKKQLILEVDNKLIIYDHGPQEIADYVTIKDLGNTVRVDLYHCKGSKSSSPGLRVDDIYEVSQQAIKSNLFANRKDFIKKINYRTNGKPEKFVIGDKNTLTEIEKLPQNVQFNFFVHVIQPGLKLDSVLADDKIKANVTALSQAVQQITTFKGLKIWGS